VELALDAMFCLRRPIAESQGGFRDVFV